MIIYKEIRLLLLLLLCIMTGTWLHAQNRLQATVRPGPHANQLDIWLKSNFNNTTEYFTNINFVLDIATSDLPVIPTLSVASADGLLTPFNWSMADVAQEIDTRTVWTFVGTNAGTTVTPFTSGAEFKIATVTFNSPVAVPIRLADYASANGGPSLQAEFYAELNVSSGVSAPTSAQRFYVASGTGTAGTTSSGDAYIQTSTMGTFPISGAFYVAPSTSLFITSGDYITVNKGDALVFSNVEGPGTLLMNSSDTQYLNLNADTVKGNLGIGNSKTVYLVDTAVVATQLVFTSGTLTIGDKAIILTAAADVTGAGTGLLAITNGTGTFIKRGLAANGSFTFPLGLSDTDNAFATVTNGSTPQDVTAQVKSYSNSASVENMTGNGVDRSWRIYTSAGAAFSAMKLSHTSASAGANYSSPGAFITRQTTTQGTWTNPNSILYGGLITTAGETVASPATFTSSSDSYYNNALVLGATATTASANNAWYSKTSRALGLADTTSAVKLRLTVLLQAAYNSGTGLMNNSLQTVNSTGVLPLGSTVANTLSPRMDYSAINNASGTVGNVTDWIEVQLRDASTPTTIVERQSFLLKTNGQVVTETGSPNLIFMCPAGSYYVTVVHRIHLGVRSAVALSFAGGTPTSYDFTTSQSQAYQNSSITTNTAMVALGSKFGLWGGNGNSNNTVRYTGASNDNTYLLSTSLGSLQTKVLANVYDNGDYNMNGNVRYTGASNDNTFLLSTVLGGTAGKIITQHQ